MKLAVLFYFTSITRNSFVENYYYMNFKKTEPVNTLVLGSNGKTGSRVLEKLTQLGWSVRAGSRSAKIPFDWEDKSTWAAALDGMKAVYITYFPDLCVSQAVDAIRSFTKTAVDSGVKKIVLLSGRGEPEAQQCEELVMKSGIEWTIVRASWFFQNFSEGQMLEPILAGHVALPIGNAGEPFVDADDISDVAVVALTEEGHSEQLYEVTGPRLITFKEAISEISKASGREIHFEQIAVQEYAATLTSYGVRGDFISLLTYLFTEVLDGRNESLTDGIEKALGRKPTDFSEYVKRTTAAGVWNSAG
jgi:uncharacterized protein YbjT (DUF2867 family)